MNWEIIKKKNLSEIKDLILKKEWAYISFSSRFRQLVKNKLKFKNDCTIIANHRKDIQYIREAVMLTRGGLILPLLEQNPEKKHYNILRFYLSSFKDYMRKLHSIMGLYNDVAIIEELLPVTASHHVEYYLMTITKNTLINPDPHSFHDLIIKKATPKDVEKLYTLQKKYELEEVFINPSHFIPGICFSHLKKMLNDEIIFYAEKNGIPVAKTQTNARGFSADQIGGVYTEYAERRKGIALYLMSILLNQIFKNKTIASLFVKKSNTPAIFLYKKLGFQIRENYRISYFFN